MKWLVSCAVCALSAVGWADNPPAFRENVELRRISEYWQEKDYAAAKQHILTFLQEYPRSPGRDALFAMLGDIYVMERNFRAAANAYEQIEDKEIRAKIAHSAVHCFYMLGAYDAVIAEAEKLIDSNQILRENVHSVRFEFAHALFQRAQTLNEEEKTKQLALALEHFQALDGTPFGDEATFYSAQIQTYFGKHPQAAQSFHRLAKTFPEKAEEYLLLAAEQELHFDRRAAIQSYEAVVAYDGKSASLAAYNQLLLLFQEGLFADVLACREKVLPLISKEQRPMIEYFTGKSLYVMGEYDRCQEHLLRFLAVPGIEATYAKNALLTLLHCAQERHQLAQFEVVLDDLKRAFPKDAETAKAIAIHAHLVRDAGNAQKALDDLREIAQQYPQYAQRDDVLFDLATLYTEEMRWQESMATCETFLQEYNDHPKRKAVMRHLVHCAIKAAREGDSAEKARCAQVLTRALQEEGVLNSEERKRGRFYLAQALCESEQHEEALLVLTDYLRDYPSDPELTQVHVCAALAYQKTDNFPFFVLHMEKALELSPQKKELHIHLYNAYLALSEKTDGTDRTELLLRAADHLHQGIAFSPKRENVQWLAHFYFQQYKEGGCNNPLYYSRATHAMERLIASGLTPETEADAIQLADWYGEAQTLEKRTSLLKSLKEVQDRDPTLPWKYPRLVVYKLAHSYQEEGVINEAIALYTFLIDSSDHTTSYFATGAKLDRAVLQFSLLDRKQKSLLSRDAQAIFDALKELSIERRLYSEPFHLEAALYYVDFKVSIVPKEKQLQYALHLLTTSRESFSEEDDALTSGYLSTREQFPEKYALYTAYMKLMDARIVLLSCLRAQAEGDVERAITLLARAEDECAELKRSAPYDERLHPRILLLEQAISDAHVSTQ